MMQLNFEKLTFSLESNNYFIIDFKPLNKNILFSYKNVRKNYLITLSFLNFQNP